MMISKVGVAYGPLLPYFGQSCTPNVLVRSVPPGLNIKENLDGKSISFCSVLYPPLKFIEFEATFMKMTK